MCGEGDRAEATDHEDDLAVFWVDMRQDCICQGQREGHCCNQDVADESLDESSGVGMMRKG